ncbi:hypothetical protein A6U87_06035 [Rhizobium sp. AC44/96]|uniref:BA14K family protein n=1 Tax=unclassified Rhizobium TaxID=2613769 RepID=UPI00080F8473|nr:MULTISPECIES: BA14K family protein [unclassified Rhizobium]MDM9623271.1 BA14K family protein [Rhizobium sp. S96]OCJ12867.1 hypothetical protein A6U87_06035 [Rhizobium sp. AC44/96]
MKTVASLTFGIASSIGLGIAVVSLTQAVMAQPEQHRLEAGTSPDLWTSTPVRVDVAKQNYDRIPAVYSTYVTDAPKVNVVDRLPVSGSPVGSTPEPDKPTFSPQHLAWCLSRYRSYDQATNTYRSFSGKTKACMSPHMPSQTGDDAVAQAQTGAALNSSTATWCAARYQSYRASDNTYQPYDGPRQTCVAPAGQEMASAR